MTGVPKIRDAGLALALGALLGSCESGQDVNSPPTASITTPTLGSQSSGSETIDNAGTGSDPDDGPLDANQFTWWVNLHQAAHAHPFVLPTSGATGGSFLVPPRGHTEDDVFLRISLAVVDVESVADTGYLDVQPRKVTLSFVTVPAGVELTLDGQPQATPFSVTGVVGMERDLGAPTPQVIGPDSLVWQAGANRVDTVNGNAVYAFWNLGSPMTDLQVGPDGALYLLGQPGASWGVDRIGRP